jgi:hypothetical protein
VTATRQTLGSGSRLNLLVDTASTPPASLTEKPVGRRPGIKRQTAYLPEPVYEQLRKLAFDEWRRMHNYIMEGLDRVFRNRGLPSIEELMILDLPLAGFEDGIPGGGPLSPGFPAGKLPAL